MSIVNYSLNNRGVRLVDSKDAWIIGKNGRKRLNPKYKFVGKIEMSMPNMIVFASDKSKPQYCGDICNLNKTAKSEITRTELDKMSIPSYISVDEAKRCFDELDADGQEKTGNPYNYQQQRLTKFVRKENLCKQIIKGRTHLHKYKWSYAYSNLEHNFLRCDPSHSP